MFIQCTQDFVNMALAIREGSDQPVHPWQSGQSRCFSHMHCRKAEESSDYLLGPVAESVASLIADPGVVRSIPAQSHTLVKIDHEMISTVILLFPLIQEGLLSVTRERLFTKYWLTS